MMAMTIRSNTRTAIAALSLAVLTTWALADGTPDSRVHKRVPHKAAAAPMTTAVQKSNGAGRCSTVSTECRGRGAPRRWCCSSTT